MEKFIATGYHTPPRGRIPLEFEVPQEGWVARETHFESGDQVIGSAGGLGAGRL